jgi:ABC-type bacteriocin/lantibiotic exporter with double-glycine peptidase domain
MIGRPKTGQRRQTPTILQMEAAECGAACLAMVLAAHGRYLTLEAARTACETSRDGIDAARLLLSARRQGMVAKAVKREIDDLASLPRPMILHWSFDHFVVLDDIRRGQFVICDPAIGRRTVSRAEMSRCFTGLALVMAPGEGFETTPKWESVTRLLMREAKDSPDALAVVALGALASVVPGIALSGVIGTYVDHIAVQGRSHWMPALMAILASIITFIAATTWLKSRTEAALRAKIGTKVAVQGFWYGLHLPLGYFSLRNAGEIAGRLRLGAELGGAVAGPLAQSLPNVVVMLAYLAIIALYSPAIALAAATVSAVNLLVLALLARRVADANRAFQMAEGRASGAAVSGLAAAGTYRALGREELLISRLASAEDQAIGAEQRLGRLRALGDLGPAASGLILSTVVIAFASMMIMWGQLTIGGLVAVQLIVGLLSAPVAALAGAVVHLQETAGALMRVADIRNNKPSPEFAADFSDVPRPAVPLQRTGTLCLKGVGFGYSRDRLLFKGLDLDLAPGRFVAIIGPSGTGKSSLARIAAGMAQPTEGTVTLDGLPLVDWDQGRLRRELQYVPQTMAVFTGTLEENVSLYDSTIRTGTIVAALDAAGLGAVVARRAGGALGHLSAFSTEMSGGEIGRLALSRAMARRPKILILDETTSALDGETEEKVLANLRAAGFGVLIITHRRRTALACDHAVLLSQGEILQGEPAAMLAAFEREDVPAPAAVATEPQRLTA